MQGIGSIKRVAAVVGEGAQVVAALHAMLVAAKTRPYFALVMLPAAPPLILDSEKKRSAATAASQHDRTAK